VGLGGSFSLMSQTLAAASSLEFRLTAAYLGQEGLEIVKNLRDQAWLEKRNNSSLTWDEYLPLGDWKADYLTLDSLGNHPFNSTPLNIDADEFYSYSPGVATKFIRKISIENISPPDPDVRRVTVQVSWEEKGRAHNFQVVEDITNWYEQ
jgi:hypothetical protein